MTVLRFTQLVCVFGDEYVCSFSKYGVNKPKFPDLTPGGGGLPYESDGDARRLA